MGDMLWRNEECIDNDVCGLKQEEGEDQGSDQRVLASERPCGKRVGDLPDMQVPLEPVSDESMSKIAVGCECREASVCPSSNSIASRSPEDDSDHQGSLVLPPYIVAQNPGTYRAFNAENVGMGSLHATMQMMQATQVSIQQSVPASMQASMMASVHCQARPSTRFNFQCPAEPQGAKPRTTAMLRNIPNSYTRAMLTELLDSEGFGGRYDFLYVPIDSNTGAGLGFAFVNFVSLMDACAFQKCFNGFKRWTTPTSKAGSVGWSNADQQGLEANIERYRNSSVMHHSVPDEYKPIILKNGLRIPFPKSIKKLRPSKVWLSCTQTKNSSSDMSCYE